MKTISIGLIFSILFILQVTISAYNSKALSYPVQSKNGMVATQDKYATQVGLDILKAGGNAIDAAVAIGYALAVTHPQAGNLGGGGFMLMYDARSEQTYALDYREKAPLKAHKDMYLDDFGNVDSNQSRFSILSTGVPGTVAGLKLHLSVLVL